MEREGCDRRGRQQRSERESLSRCMTAVLAQYIELFNGPVNAAGMKIISVLQTFYLTLPLPFLLLPFYPKLPPPCLKASVGLVWQRYGFHQSITTSEAGRFSETLFFPIFAPFFFSLRSRLTLLGTTFLSVFFLSEFHCISKLNQ